LFFLFSFVVLSLAQELSAACVRFDVCDVIACTGGPTDLDPIPGCELVEARFDISTFVHYGHDDDLVQFVFIVESPNRTARMVGYSPRNELGSEIAGTMNFTRQTEHNRTFGLTGSAQFENLLSASSNASDSVRESENVQYQSSPPKQQLVASGTLSRGHGVYFKIRPSSQTSLEGAKSFTLVLAVPSEWRADWLRVRCAAYSRRVASRSESAEPICGSASFLVALHRAGDSEAREAAHQLVAAERSLRDVSRNLPAAPAQDSHDSLGSVIRSLFGNRETTRVPHDYVDQLVFNRAVSRAWHHEQHLPVEVREAVSAFLAARSRVDELALANASTVEHRPPVQASQRLPSESRVTRATKYRLPSI
jgi:hypothetical protein